MDIKFYIEKWKNKFYKLKAAFDESINMLDEKDKRIEELEKEVNKLNKLLLKSGGKVVKKTSRNSDLPPSKDITKQNRNKSPREKSKKPSGGQKGHEGHYLEMVKPDQRIPMIPKACENCGKYLDLSKKKLIDSKQEIDIPVPKVIVTQYDRYEVGCSCGCNNVGKYPDRLKSQVQYGSRIRSLINYMSVYQYMPYKRLQIFFEDVFNLHFSQGTIFNTLKRTSSKSTGIYEFIRNYLELSEVVGADETVIWVNGNKCYNWVWQNKKVTYIVCEESRRKDVIYKHFPHGFVSAILVSDRYKAHLSTPSAGYQICWSHLIRLVNYLLETEESEWVHKLLSLYRRSKSLEKEKGEWKRGEKEVECLEHDLNELLQEQMDGKKYPETKRLYNSLIVNRQAIFTFLYHEDVPSHNNSSEQAIRNAKVKLKISGQFKSGQHYYAKLRSLIDTLIKNDKPILETLFDLERGIPISLGI